MHIAFITHSYPSNSEPTACLFVEQFVWAMARQGHQCTVIRPIGLLQRRIGPLPPAFENQQRNGLSVLILSPRIFTETVRKVCGVNLAPFTHAHFVRSVKDAIDSLLVPPDMYYGHFLYHGGHAAVKMGELKGKPSIVRVGEGTYWTVEPYGWQFSQDQFSAATGFISNSTSISNSLVDKLGIPREKIITVPNGVDLDRFHPMDKKECRKDWDVRPDDFAIAFVGTFDHLKGGRRLVQAVEGMDNVRLLMAGTGPFDFRSDDIAYKGFVERSKIPSLLNSADIFVLPTLEEGSCNAVIEAMACGLPIVTSSGNYMDDIVDKNVAIRVDPMDVQALKKAILLLKGDPVRRQAMSAACLCKAMQFDIKEKAKLITEWIEETARKYSRDCCQACGTTNS